VTSVILDSGILIASVYPETVTSQAKGLLKQLQVEQAPIHAPTLLRYELNCCVAESGLSIFKHFVAQNLAIIRGRSHAR